MKFTRTLLLGMMAIMLLSCETRKDIFHQFNSAPKVFVNVNSRDFSEQNSNVSVLLRHGCEQTIYFDYTDDYIESGINVEYAVFSENSDTKYITCTMDPESRKVVVTDILPSTTINEKVLKFTVKIIVSDYYGDKGEASINVADFDNLPPDPVIEFSPIQSMEYRISAEASSDSDGDKIVAYEYLIDGETTINESGYENPSDPSCLLNPGMAGRKGTYIISTPLSTVKHAFQTTGTHTVYVRAKDNLGLWSTWKSTTIDVQ